MHRLLLHDQSQFLLRVLDATLQPIQQGIDIADSPSVITRLVLSTHDLEDERPSLGIRLSVAIEPRKCAFEERILLFYRRVSWKWQWRQCQAAPMQWKFSEVDLRTASDPQLTLPAPWS